MNTGKKGIIGHLQIEYHSQCREVDGLLETNWEEKVIQTFISSMVLIGTPAIPTSPFTRS